MPSALQPPEVASQPTEPLRSWPDERLVGACLDGNQEAWSGLIEKYKRLIYSIPLKYGATRDDAADIFQAVCLEMFCGLAKLQKVESLRSWIITITIHKAYHWNRRDRLVDLGLDGTEAEQVEEDLPHAPDIIEQVEREQMVRDAVAVLPERCTKMINLLFYEYPPIPYAEVGRRLGLAASSIGFIRGRCLKRLEQALRKMCF